MNKFCTILSVVLSVACFFYMFNENIIYSCLCGIVTLILVILGYFFESRAPYYWNTKLNKLLYYISRNDKEYNITSKELIYTCMDNNEYRSEKNIVIYPTCDKLDRITERFAWSAPSAGAAFLPVVNTHTISGFRQQELWTYYSVYFQHVCTKHKDYQTGSIITNLIDHNNAAVPFLSATVDRKTKLLVMKVCFKNITPPSNVSFKIVTTKSPTKEIYSEELVYDAVLEGVSKTIHFPRQSWKYVISWE